MKPLFRFHLSTLVLMSLLAGGAIWLNTSEKVLPAQAAQEVGIVAVIGQPIPWKLCFIEKDNNDPQGSRIHRITAHSFHMSVLNIIRIDYDYVSGISYVAIAIDIVIWLVVLLIAGVLIEWLTRRLSKPQKT